MNDPTTLHECNSIMCEDCVHDKMEEEWYICCPHRKYLEIVSKVYGGVE